MVPTWLPALAVAVLAGLLYLRKLASHPKKPAVDSLVKAPGGRDGLLVLHVFPGTAAAVSQSPSSAKLLCYCRLAGIEHELGSADMSNAPKGKLPFIRHQGCIIADSQLIIRYLENTYDVPAMAAAAAKSFKQTAFAPFALMSAADQAQCDMVRLLCEGELYWALVSIRWGGAVGITNTEKSWHTTVSAYFRAVPALLRPLVVRIIRKIVYTDARGYGLVRHSPKDQLYLASRAIKALSTQLGGKQFMLGFPSECDAAAFGILQCLCDDGKWPNPLSAYMRAECANLVEYSARLKAVLFP